MSRDEILATLVDALRNPALVEDALRKVEMLRPLRRDQKRERKRAALCVAYCKGLTNAELERGRA